MNEEKKTDTVCEAVEQNQVVEDLREECKDLQKQNELLMKQHIGLEDRYNLDKARWRQHKADMQAENDALRAMNKQLEHTADKLRCAESQERRKKIATVPKLVIIAFFALAMCAVPYILQNLCVIGPQLRYGLQTGLMMAISWCYALIWDRTRK